MAPRNASSINKLFFSLMYPSPIIEKTLNFLISSNTIGIWITAKIMLKIVSLPYQFISC
jgi:hypothetical protein